MNSTFINKETSSPLELNPFQLTQAVPPHLEHYNENYFQRPVSEASRAILAQHFAIFPSLLITVLKVIISIFWQFFRS